jgi:hypothetical protein
MTAGLFHTDSGQAITDRKTTIRLRPWMRFVLYFCSTTSVIAGASMVAAYDLVYGLIGVDPSTLALPIQISGFFYVLIGFALALIPRDPAKHASLLLFTVYAKIGCSIFLLAYIVSGQIPFALLLVILIVDVIFVLPLWWIQKHIEASIVRRPKSVQ